MPFYSKQECKDVLDLLHAALLAGNGKGTTTVDSISITWQSLTELNSAITYWEKKHHAASGARTKTIIYR